MREHPSDSLVYKFGMLPLVVCLFFRAVVPVYVFMSDFFVFVFTMKLFKWQLVSLDFFFVFTNEGSKWQFISVEKGGS